jgi:hypothetical protein
MSCCSCLPSLTWLFSTAHSLWIGSNRLTGERGNRERAEVTSAPARAPPRRRSSVRVRFPRGGGVRARVVSGRGHYIYIVDVFGEAGG